MLGLLTMLWKPDHRNVKDRYIIALLMHSKIPHPAQLHPIDTSERSHTTTLLPSNHTPTSYTPPSPPTIQNDLLPPPLPHPACGAIRLCSSRPRPIRLLHVRAHPPGRRSIRAHNLHDNLVIAVGLILHHLDDPHKVDNGVLRIRSR